MMETVFALSCVWDSRPSSCLSSMEKYHRPDGKISFLTARVSEKESEQFIAILFLKENFDENEHILRSARRALDVYFINLIFSTFFSPLKNNILGLSRLKRHKVILFWIKIASRVTNIWRLTRSSGDEMQNDSFPSMWKCVDVLTQFGKLDTLGLSTLGRRYNKLALALARFALAAAHTHRE